MLPKILRFGLERGRKGRADITDALSIALMEHLNALERNLGVIGTIAVIAPFVGLFGTVLGIIHAFDDIAIKGNSTPAVVAAGVGEALITTAAGLFVAVLAVIFFNYFKARIKAYNQEMIVAANQLAEMLHFHNVGDADSDRSLQAADQRRAAGAFTCQVTYRRRGRPYVDDVGAARQRGDGGDQHHAVHRRVAGLAHHLHDPGSADHAARLPEGTAQQQLFIVE